MKLTLITNGLNSGGSERVLSMLANSMSDKGYEVEVIVLMDDIVFYPIDEHVKLIFVEKECNSKSLIRKLLWLHKYLKQQKTDLLIAFLQRVYCFAILASLGLHIPIISSERNDPRYFIKLYKLLIRIFLPFTTHFVVQTQRIKDYYPKFIQRKTTIIGNPVNECIFDVDLNIPKENKIVSVGRLFPQKNQKILINAFAKIEYKYPQYKLVIYGEGPLRSELESQIKHLKLQDKIILPGKSLSIYEDIKNAKVFCMSSNYEGMSNAMIEAICLGLPIITTKVSGTDELIVENKNGLLVNLNDEEGFSEALDLLLSDNEMIKKFSNNNIKMSTRFKSDYIFNQWDKLIQQVFNSYNK